MFSCICENQGVAYGRLLLEKIAFASFIYFRTSVCLHGVWMRTIQRRIFIPTCFHKQILRIFRGGSHKFQNNQPKIRENILQFSCLGLGLNLGPLSLCHLIHNTTSDHLNVLIFGICGKCFFLIFFNFFNHLSSGLPETKLTPWVSIMAKWSSSLLLTQEFLSSNHGDSWIFFRSSFFSSFLRKIIWPATWK